MIMTVAHVLLTRFNLPSPGAESLVRAREGWLRDRQWLFERYCVPSVRAQSNQNFTWVIYFDPHSPDWLRRRISELSADGLFTPIFRESVSTADLVTDVRGVVDGVPDRLITTNLDNDDALAVDFVDRVQTCAPRQGRRAVYLTRGLIRFHDHVYVRRDASNAFCSVAEPAGDPMTCWVDWHNALAGHMPVVQDPGPPAWLQVVHGGNVSNRVRGRLVSPQRYEALFGDLLSGVAVPSRGDRVRERLWDVPRRLGIEVLRLAAKRVILAVGGRGALDKVKQAAFAKGRTAGS